MLIASGGQVSLVSDDRTIALHGQKNTSCRDEYEPKDTC